MHNYSGKFYGLRCLIYLSNNKDDFIPIKNISEYYGISYEHLTKIVHTLAVLGYIESKKGKNGVIKITTKAAKSRLGDLIVRLEPNMNIVECFDSKTNTCKIISFCKLKLVLYDAQQSFINSLNKYTLSEMPQVLNRDK